MFRTIKQSTLLKISDGEQIIERSKFFNFMLLVTLASSGFFLGHNLNILVLNGNYYTETNYNLIGIDNIWALENFH